ncbi:MAG: glycoside hydrolase family 140 protein [Chloroflexi bacterium]|nr:glycoside hydrolase family 140 protein [Chloroflexota bacterium]
MPTRPTDQSFVFPLKISANRRFLVDQNERPFLIHGDTAWSLIAALDEAEVERYLVDRAAKGFNALIVNLIEHKFNGPLNRHGEHPFHNPQDLSTPNDRYFEFADWVLGKAADYGFVVFLAPLYLGYKHKAEDDGWYHEARSGGVNRCYRYGCYLGERYAAFKNLIWMMGGDRNPDGVVDEVNSVILGIKEFDPHSLFTAHAHPEELTPERYGWGGWLDLNGTYTYRIVHKRLLLDYNHKPVMPFVLMESSYEGEHNASPVQIRRQAYWANLSGATGQFLGNNPIWLFNPGWQEALDSQGSRDMVHVKTLFTSRAWYNLVPDQSHTVVTDGLGEFNGLDYLAVALTRDGRTLIAYMPTARTITVDLSKVSGEQAVGWWFNPRTGAAQPAGEFPTRGQVQLAPPGEDDWALIMDDAAQDLPAPGESSHND